MSTLKVLISGGGPIGLSFALLLEELMGDSVAITLYDARWQKSQSTVIWRANESLSARRQQVITLQSRHYLEYSKEIRERIFQKEAYSEVWPEGQDSIRGHPPRNIRIAHLEDILLEVANEKSSTINLVPRPFHANKMQKELKDHHILAICEGGNSRTREHFIDKFGQADTAMYSINGQHVQDTILGLKVKSELSDPMSMLLTIAQNRFLLNTLNGDGFLNIRLSDEETQEAVGMDMSRHEVHLKRCIQSEPCLMEVSKQSSEHFYCATHSTVFLPALLKVSPLWARIQEGLKLFKIKPENLTAITTFKLDLVHRPRFSSMIYPNTAKQSGTFAFLLGDAANAIHFWSGRGLNHGIASAVSLSQCINEKWQSKPFSDADFTQHEGNMSMLQYRHKTRAWHTMTAIDSEGNTYAIKDKISESIFTGENDQLNKLTDLEILLVRLEKIKQRLQSKVNNLPTQKQLRQHLNILKAETLRTLVQSDAWNTQLMAGAEVDVDILCKKPTLSTRITFEPENTLAPTKNKLAVLASLCYVEGAKQALELQPRLDLMDKKELRIGRNIDWSDLYLNDRAISRYHAVIIISDHGISIQDKGSMGGTYLNGERLEANVPTLLKHSDHISFSRGITYKVMLHTLNFASN